jgi:peroxiredoxin
LVEVLMKNALASFAVVVVAWAAGDRPAIAAGQTTGARQRIDVSKLGPQVGQRVPDFTLPDQEGRDRSLQSIMGPRGAMIVFVRSADWCPYCRTQLVDLQGQVDALRAQGLGLAAITYDSRAILAGFAERQRITYPLLSDEGSAVIKRYGILNTVVDEALGPNGKDAAVLADLRVYATVNAATENLRGIPFPGTFIVDRQGRVTSRFFEDYYRERMTTANILLRTGRTASAVRGTQVTTSHLDVRTYPSDATIALGNRFSVAVEITPKKGMHVYAPGAKNYRVVSLDIAPQPYVRVLPTAYPASQIYHFKPLNERVATYQKPFTLLVEIVPQVTAEAQKAFAGRKELTLTGTLEYQACDDRICYNPTSVPLSWTVDVKPNVAGAPPPPATR